MTIERFIRNQQAFFPQASGQLTHILQDMAMAAKLIAREVNRAGITNILGESESTNPSGEKQQQLDLLADKIIYQVNYHTGRLCALASEEHQNIIKIATEQSTGKYILLYDPLDGSSNIDVNVSIGTIFSIHQKCNLGGDCTLEDVLQIGQKIVAAGYITYSGSTMMVYSTGLGVHTFTLDPTIGEFILTEANLRIPDEPCYYSINHGNERFWSVGLKRYIHWLQGIEGNNPKPLTHRYNGSLVSDFHRNLLKGGIYIYLGTVETNDYAGKIRLMYEAQPLAFIAEQAGGYSSDGLCDLLKVEAKSLHQRTPVFMGNYELVKQAEHFLAKYDKLSI